MGRWDNIQAAKGKRLSPTGCSREEVSIVAIPKDGKECETLLFLLLKSMGGAEADLARLTDTDMRRKQTG